MEVNTGAILAMASYPTFEPQLFVGGIDVDSFEELSERQAFNNLAIQGVKPPASTFKAITYVTAMEENIFPAGVSTPGGDHRVLSATGTSVRGRVAVAMEELDLPGDGRAAEPP